MFFGLTKSRLSHGSSAPKGETNKFDNLGFFVYPNSHGNSQIEDSASQTESSHLYIVLVAGTSAPGTGTVVVVVRTCTRGLQARKYC